MNAYPSERANFVQISDFVSALSRQAQTTFIVPLDRSRMTDGEWARLKDARVIPVPLSGPGKYLGIARALLSHGRKADHIYTRSPKVARIAAALSRAPVTVELHETLSPGMSAALQRNSRIDLVTISQMQRDALAAEGALRVSCVPLSTSGWPEDAGVVPVYDLAYAGSAAPGKGVERLIEAARARPDLRVLVICKMDAEMAATLPENVEVTGFLPHAEVGPRLAQARLLVAPYEKRIFGADRRVDISATMSPLKIFEYMSLGRPIIAADIPAVRTLLGDLGLYFEPGSTAGLLAAVDAAASAPPDLGPRLQALWKTSYSTEARARQMIETWQKCS
ncbi:glycosyltransferase [Salipiger thiooxidans]|uniref:glycosyltransferase n=1 Tax=Salipiger thiooxidans TaxID=282683 RepID=UPI001A8EF196|nr:glycosyltransferase [Salipiger thiooxidans]